MKILVVDGNNFAYRAWAAVHELNEWGASVGGTIGFIRIIKCIIRDLKPDKVIVSWDADSGSLKRKELYPAYKGTRHAEHPDYGAQMVMIKTLLSVMNVHQVLIEGVESDDIIAYITQNMYPGHTKIIASADGDMLQLVRWDTQIWNPDKKMLLSVPEVVEKTGVLPENFAIIKAFQGDKSDNIPGVPGIGAKTALKLFPDLARKQLSSDDICIQTTDAINKDSRADTMYTRTVGHWKQFELNYKLMNLAEPLLDEGQIDQIHDQLRAGYEKYTNFDAFQATLHHLDIRIGDRDLKEVIEEHQNRVLNAVD